MIRYGIHSDHFPGVGEMVAPHLRGQFVSAIPPTAETE